MRGSRSIGQRRLQRLARAKTHFEPGAALPAMVALACAKNIASAAPWQHSKRRKDPRHGRRTGRPRRAAPRARVGVEAAAHPAARRARPRRARRDGARGEADLRDEGVADTTKPQGRRPSAGSTHNASSLVSHGGARQHMRSTTRIVLAHALSGGRRVVVALQRQHQRCNSTAAMRIIPGGGLVQPGDGQLRCRPAWWRRSISAPSLRCASVSPPAPISPASARHLRVIFRGDGRRARGTSCIQAASPSPASAARAAAAPRPCACSARPPAPRREHAAGDAATHAPERMRGIAVAAMAAQLDASSMASTGRPTAAALGLDPSAPAAATVRRSPPTGARSASAMRRLAASCRRSPSARAWRAASSASGVASSTPASASTCRKVAIGSSASGPAQRRHGLPRGLVPGRGGAVTQRTPSSTRPRRRRATRRDLRRGTLPSTAARQRLPAAASPALRARGSRR